MLHQGLRKKSFHSFTTYSVPFLVPRRDEYLHVLFQDLYSKENNGEKYVPSKLQAASKLHKMPFSPSSQKAYNVKMVVQVSLFVTIHLMNCIRKLYYTHKCGIEVELIIREDFYPL